MAYRGGGEKALTKPPAALVYLRPIGQMNRKGLLVLLAMKPWNQAANTHSCSPISSLSAPVSLSGWHGGFYGVPGLKTNGQWRQKHLQGALPGVCLSRFPSAKNFRFIMNSSKSTKTKEFMWDFSVHAQVREHPARLRVTINLLIANLQPFYSLLR